MAGVGAAGAMPQYELYRLRYSRAVNGVGKGVMKNTLQWLYKGGTSSFRDYLFLVLCYTNTKYKREFDLHQRQKLDDGDSVDTFDVTLIYALLKRTCGLSEVDVDWTTQNPNNPTLENSLYSVKQHRNRLSHEAFILTDQDLKNIFQELEQLYCGIYEKSGAMAGKDKPYITRISKEVQEELLSLSQKIREAVDPSDLPLLQQEIRQCNERLKYEVEQLSNRELENYYNRLCVVKIAPWLQISGQNFKASDLFTDIILKEEKILSNTQQQRRTDSEVVINHLFQIRTQENHLPNVMIFTGDGGQGKTTWLKYIFEKWTVGDTDISGLGNFKLLLYTEMRHPHISSVEQLLDSLLCQTRQNVGISVAHLKSLILEMPVLFILDGYDEKNQASFELLYEILHLPGDSVKVIISTRPSCTHEINKLVPLTKHKINFVLHGISPAHHPDFIEKHIRCLVKSSKTGQEKKDDLVKKLPVLRQEFGEHLNSPLTLTLLTLLWVECPDTLSVLATSTRLFEEFRNLVTGKLEYKLQQNGITDVAYKCSEFLKCYDKLCLQSFLRNEYELESATVEELENKCRSLGLPPEYVLSSFFTVTRTIEKLKMVTKLKPHHLRFQEHGAGRHIVSQLVSQNSNSDDGDDEIRQILLHNDPQSQLTESEPRLENILLHITGSMAILHSSLFEKYAPQILALVSVQVNEYGGLQVSPLLRHITESRNNWFVMQATANRLKELSTTSSQRSEWVVEENCIGALQKLLKITAPDTVNIVIVSDPEDVHYLKVALWIMSSKVKEMEMYLMKHYWEKCTTGASDDLLEISMTNIHYSGDQCCLKGWGGCLSEAAIFQLPNTLVYLALRLDLPAVQKLSEHLPRLTQLNQLELHVDDEDRKQPNEFPTLNFAGDVLRVFLCSGITDHLPYVTWAADVVLKMWPKGRNKLHDALGFRNSKITSTGAALLVHMLASRGLPGVSYLWIEFPQVMAAEEVDQLKSLSTELLSARLYV